MEWLKWLNMQTGLFQDGTGIKYFDLAEDGNNGVQIEMTEYCPLRWKSI
jgi:hypothetical protein